MTKKIPKITVWIGCLGALKESIKIGRHYVLNVRTDCFPASSSLSLVFVSKKARFNRISNDVHTRINIDDRCGAYAAWSKVRVSSTGNGEDARILITPLVIGIVDIDVLFFFKEDLRAELRLEFPVERLNPRGATLNI